MLQMIAITHVMYGANELSVMSLVSCVIAFFLAESGCLQVIWHGEFSGGVSFNRSFLGTAVQYYGTLST